MAFREESARAEEMVHEGAHAVEDVRTTFTVRKAVEECADLAPLPYTALHLIGILVHAKLHPRRMAKRNKRSKSWRGETVLRQNI